MQTHSHLTTTHATPGLNKACPPHVPQMQTPEAPAPHQDAPTAPPVSAQKSTAANTYPQAHWRVHTLSWGTTLSEHIRTHATTHTHTPPQEHSHTELPVGSNITSAIPVNTPSLRAHVVFPLTPHPLGMPNPPCEGPTRTELPCVQRPGPHLEASKVPGISAATSSQMLPEVPAPRTWVWLHVRSVSSLPQSQPSLHFCTSSVPGQGPALSLLTSLSCIFSLHLSRFPHRPISFFKCFY